MPSRDDIARDVWQLLLEVTIEQHRERYERVTDAADVSMSQAQAILELDPDQAVPMSVLAQCLHNDPSNITGIVDRLEAEGLVERRGPPPPPPRQKPGLHPTPATGSGAPP